MDVYCDFCKGACENGFGNELVVICNKCITQMYNELKEPEDTTPKRGIPKGWRVLNGGLNI